MPLKVLLPLPKAGFDPTETGVPWQKLSTLGHQIVVATPDGKPAEVDERVLTGKDLGIFKNALKADENGQAAFRKFENSREFQTPLRYEEIIPFEYDAVLLPGGHAPGMKRYLESEFLQQVVAWMMDVNRPVGAICHGVVLAARSKSEATGKSVLHGRRTTALPKYMEMSAWAVTAPWLGSYYRTYKQSVQDEVKAALEFRSDFRPGPTSLFRDRPDALKRGYVVRDGNYLSARWPGDAHQFADCFAQMLREEETRIQ
jgi:protease I